MECLRTAKDNGGNAVIDWHVSTGGEDIIVKEVEPRMGSKDFGWYLTKLPGMLFRFETHNEELGCTALAHKNDFCIDEVGMKPAIRAFLAYISQE